MPGSFVGSCVQLDGDDITDMVDQAVDIKAETFRKNIGSEAYQWLESELGYSDLPNISLAKDYHVSFHRSKYQGEKCYYCRWSAIEYVFVV
jgi:hypothetical protein